MKTPFSNIQLKDAVEQLDANALVGLYENKVYKSGINKFPTAVSFNTNNCSNLSSCKIDTSRVLLAYRESSTTNYGVLQIAKNVGDTIEYGAKLEFSTTTTYDVSACKADTDKAFVAYSVGSAYKGIAMIVSISDKTISVGTTVSTGSTNTKYNKVIQADTNGALLVFADGSNNYYGTGRMLNVSGVTISAGTTAVFRTAACSNYMDGDLINTNKILVGFEDTAGSDLYSTIATINVTTVSFSSNVQISSEDTNYVSVSKYSDDQAMMVYQNTGRTRDPICATLLEATATTITTIIEETIINSTTSTYIDSDLIDTSKVLVTYMADSLYKSMIITATNSIITSSDNIIISGDSSENKVTAIDSNIAMSFNQLGDSYLFKEFPITGYIATPAINVGLDKKCGYVAF